MCGIVGYIGRGNEDDIKTMLKRIEYRGPDDNGVYNDDYCGLGHARLSIVDISSAGHQPMFTSDSQVGIVFNGEIYNFNELKKDLPEVKFKSTTDTEVILYLYKKYGIDFLKKIHGMFALALYDVKYKKIILARDRIGKKPLYWTKDSHGYIFASELSSLCEHQSLRNNKPKISEQALQLYLTHDYIPTPWSIYENIYKLEPGTYLSIDLTTHNHIHKEFWNGKDIQIKESKYTEALGELKTTLTHAVQDRLVADVPVGIFLSGGLDSSIIAALAQKNSTKKIKTFSVGFNEKSFDESVYAKKVAHHIGSEHYHAVLTEEDCRKIIPEIFSRIDEPLADPSIIPTYLLSQFARKHVKVVLGGDGADELFAGYPTFFAEKIYTRYLAWLPHRILNIIQLLILVLAHIIGASEKNFDVIFKLLKFSDGFTQNRVERHMRFLGSFTQGDIKNVLLHTQENNFDVYMHDKSYEKMKLNDTGNSLLHVYMKTYLQDGVMVKLDRASMFNSLEARSPFLDTRLVHTALSMPFNFKFNGYTTKFILKELAQELLPNIIISRSKKGFGIPVNRWLKHELNPLLHECVSQNFIEKQGLFNFDYIQKLIQEHENDRVDHRKKLWNILVFQLWWRYTYLKR